MSLPTISTINNGESAWVIRQKLNENFASILSALWDRWLSWSWSYDNATQYQKWNVVYYGSALYIAKNDVIWLIPTNTSAWDFLLDWPQGIPWVDWAPGADADFYKYSITISESGGNLTVTLKNYEGNDPTPSKPVKIQIGGVIRTITANVFTYFLNAWTNWWNTWSAELATKEIDWFVYILDYNNSGAVFNLWISRYPLYNNLSEATWWYTSEKYLMQAWNIWIENVVNIWRFAATLSAGGAYTWSIPATSVIINRPCYETRWLDWVWTVRTWTNAPTSMTISYKYKIEWEKLFVKWRASGTQNASNSWTTIDITWPFSTPWAYHDMVYWTALWTDNATFDEFSLWAFRWNVWNGIWFLFQTTTGRRPNELNYSYMVQI